MLQVSQLFCILLVRPSLVVSVLRGRISPAGILTFGIWIQISRFIFEWPWHSPQGEYYAHHLIKKFINALLYLSLILKNRQENHSRENSQHLLHRSFLPQSLIAETSAAPVADQDTLSLVLRPD